MLLVVLALVLWLGFNFAVVFTDLALVLREDRAARRERPVLAGASPLRRRLHLRH
jgi:hypothetical protein